MTKNKKHVSCYLTDEEARILKESAYSQTDLIKQDICGFVIGNRDYYDKINEAKQIITVIDKQISVLEEEKQKYERKIEEYNEKLASFSFNNTEQAKNAILEFNQVLQTNKDRRFNLGVKGFGMNKVPLKIAESIAENANITLRHLLSNTKEDLMIKELEGYSTLLKRWHIDSMKELKKK